MTAAGRRQNSSFDPTGNAIMPAAASWTNQTNVSCTLLWNLQKKIAHAVSARSPTLFSEEETHAILGDCAPRACTCTTFYTPVIDILYDILSIFCLQRAVQCGSHISSTYDTSQYYRPSNVTSAIVLFEATIPPFATMIISMNSVYLMVVQTKIDRERPAGDAFPFRERCRRY